MSRGETPYKRYRDDPTGDQCGCGSSLNWPPREISVWSVSGHFFLTEWANIVTFHPKHPISKTMSIPVTFIWEPPPPLPRRNVSEISWFIRDYHITQWKEYCWQCITQRNKTGNKRFPQNMAANLVVTSRDTWYVMVLASKKGVSWCCGNIFFLRDFEWVLFKRFYYVNLCHWY